MFLKEERYYSYRPNQWWFKNIWQEHCQTTHALHKTQRKATRMKKFSWWINEIFYRNFGHSSASSNAHQIANIILWHGLWMNDKLNITFSNNKFIKFTRKLDHQTYDACASLDVSGVCSAACCNRLCSERRRSDRCNGDRTTRRSQYAWRASVIFVVVAGATARSVVVVVVVVRARTDFNATFRRCKNTLHGREFVK